MAKDEIHETKKTVSIFCPSRNSRLSYSDLLVYCYRADQHRYSTVPSCRRVAKSTGLREATISEATGRLVEHGLLSSGNAVITPCPKQDWFITLDALKEQNPEGPELRWFQNWKSLVRRPGSDNPLTVPAVMIYSAIRHSVMTRWKPQGGWTYEYLALITATNVKTVAASLDTLGKLGFLIVLDGLRFRLYRLRDSQMSCFADRGVWSGNSAEPDEMMDDFAPGSEQWDRRAEARRAFEAHMERWPISTKARQAIISRVMQQAGWEQHWDEWSLKLVDKFLDHDPSA